MKFCQYEDIRVLMFDADDEEPKCGECIFGCGCSKCEECGSEYGWKNYARLKNIEDYRENFKKLIHELSIELYRELYE